MNTQKLLDQLQDGIRCLTTTENYQAYLQAMTRFHSYSYANSVLIWLQRPDATMVHGYAAWRKDFNRHVRKGEKGIRILAPAKQKNEEDEPLYYFPVTVFDISQTEGEELPVLPITILQGDADQSFLPSLEAISPVPIRYEKDLSANGLYRKEENTICIDAGLPYAQKVKTLLHELAHAAMHRQADLPRWQMEIEAESVAYVVSSNYGLDTSGYSFPYIASWSASPETFSFFPASLASIQKTAEQFIDQLVPLLGPSEDSSDSELRAGAGTE